MVSIVALLSRAIDVTVHPSTSKSFASCATLGTNLPILALLPSTSTARSISSASTSSALAVSTTLAGTSARVIAPNLAIAKSTNLSAAVYSAIS